LQTKYKVVNQYVLFKIYLELHSFFGDGKAFSGARI